MPEPAGPGTINPLLNSDGTGRLHPAWNIRRVRHGPDGSGLPLATDGSKGSLHARSGHERPVRRYELSVDPAAKADADMAREVSRVTRSGNSASW